MLAKLFHEKSVLFVSGGKKTKFGVEKVMSNLNLELEVWRNEPRTSNPYHLYPELCNSGLN
jgi:hypothetical protein